MKKKTKSGNKSLGGKQQKSKLEMIWGKNKKMKKQGGDDFG